MRKVKFAALLSNKFIYSATLGFTPTSTFFLRMTASIISNLGSDFRLNIRASITSTTDVGSVVIFKILKTEKELKGGSDVI